MHARLSTLGPHARRHVRPGFSFIELVITVAIIGVLAIIAVPRYASSQERYRVDAAARRVIADLRAAQETARATSKDQRIRFGIGSSKYHLSFSRSATSSGIAVGSDSNAGSSSVDLGAEPYRATVVGANINGYAGIVFDPYGSPSGGGTILLRVGGTAAQITVDPDNGAASSEVRGWIAVPAPVRTSAASATPMAVNASYRDVKSAAVAAAEVN